MTVSPDKAYELLNGQVHWINLDSVLIDALRTIAKMTVEFAVEVCSEGGGWTRVTEWTPDPDVLQSGELLRDNERVVRRLVSNPEP